MEDGEQAEYLNHIRVYELIKMREALQISLMKESALPALKMILEGGDFWEKCIAIESLGMMGGEKAMRLLKSVLRNPEWMLRETAIVLLKTKKLVWLDKELEKMMERDPVYVVRSSAEKAINDRKRIFLPPKRRNLPDNFGNLKQAEKRLAGR
jgi:HEAT repeat protein